MTWRFWQHGVSRVNKSHLGARALCLSGRSPSIDTKRLIVLLNGHWVRDIQWGGRTTCYQDGWGGIAAQAVEEG